GGSVGGPDGRYDGVLMPQQAEEWVDLSLPAREIGTDGALEVEIVVGDELQALGQPEQAAAHISVLAVTQRPVAEQASRESLVPAALFGLSLPRHLGRDPLDRLRLLGLFGESLGPTRLPSFPCHDREGDSGDRGADRQEGGHGRPAPCPPGGPAYRADWPGA